MQLQREQIRTSILPLLSLDASSIVASSVSSPFKAQEKPFATRAPCSWCPSMPALLLRPGLNKTALISLSAAGATGLVYVSSGAESKQALQVSLTQTALITQPVLPTRSADAHAGGRSACSQKSIANRRGRHSVVSILVSSAVWNLSRRLSSKYALQEGRPCQAKQLLHAGD